MTLDKRYYINTGKDGELGDTTADDVRAAVAAGAAAERLVLHFHGGLVKKSSGLATATRLTPVYQAAGAHPISFVWESGLLETLGHNLPEILDEKLFNRILKRILKHAVGKLTTESGTKAITGQLTYPTDIEVALELRKTEVTDGAPPSEPYAGLRPEADLDDVSDAELEAFEKELQEDAEFQAEVRAIALDALPDVVVQEDGDKGVARTARRSRKSLLSPDVVVELEEDTDQGQKGFFTSAKIIKHAAKVLFRVVRRFVKHRHHGVYVTVVEEILRELYIANVGGTIWQMMKKETLDTFAHDGGTRGGRLFVDALGAELATGKRPRITLVGHSTGAVFILNLLVDVDRCRKDPLHPWPADVGFESVLFLAPACDFVAFEELLARRELFADFRMYAMDDEHEKDDTLVPGIYPRSLLYFVSGVVERRANGKSAYDRPVLGMQRFYSNEDVFDGEAVSAGRAFLDEHPRHVVWSVADAGDGRRSNAVSHGGFDDTDDADPALHTTMQSVQHVIREGQGA